MNQNQARALVACLFSFACGTASADFGRTSGSFDVATSGSATYSVPIWTPPGPNGLTPSISLSYDSQGGNGVEGVGWNLSAVSSIERCGRNKHQDGNAWPVDLSMSDRYCMGGSRLRLGSGTYGAAGSVYYTEIANYSRITAYGTAGSGPAYFIVEAKSGLKYEYGATTSSRVFPGVSPTISTTANRWMLNKVYDRNGNNYVITYNNLNGFAVPDIISWTPTYLGSPSYRYEAKFNYINTRTDIDAYRGQVSGFEVRNHFRLENIQIKSNTTVVRKYVFAYDTSSVTSRSRLTSAKECADDSELNCFLPISFAYQTGVAGVTAGAGTAPAGSSNSLSSGRFDFNGDGKDDIIYKNGATWYAAFGANSGFAGPYNTGISGNVLPDRYLPNGRDGIATIVSGNLYIYRWDDATSSFTGVNTGIASAAPSLATDYDGNGLADLVYYTSGNATLNIRTNTSTGSTNPSFASSLIANTLPSSPPNTTYWGGLMTSINFGQKRVDFNGDGRQDLYATIVTSGPSGATVSNVNLLAQSTGYLSGTSYSVMTGPIAFAPALNFNGDQCSDLLHLTTVYISPCKSAAASTLVAPTTASMLLDWNGDGKTDLLSDNGGTFGVYLSTGAGFSSLIATSIPSPGGFALDQDGDGLDDLIKPNGSGALSYWTHTASGSVPSYAANVPDLLSSVTDGFGVNQTANYVSTASSNYDKGAATNFPLQEAEPSIVVAQVTSSNGIGSTYNKNYFYVGAREHAERSDTTWFQSSGYVGFQRVDETDSRNGLITRTYLEQTFPVSGMVSQVQQMQPNGTTTISQEIFTNSFTTLDNTANNQRYFAYPSASTATQYEVGGTWNNALLSTVATSNTFDNASGTLYDRIVTTTEPGSGANGVNAGGVWTARTYSPVANFTHDTTNWCLGRPGRTQQINSHNLTYGASITRTSEILWNSALCRPTQTVTEPLDPNLEVTTGIGYDGFGNVSSTTVTGVGMPARTTSTIYSDATYTTGQFPLSITQQVSSTFSQTTTNTWNYDLGVPLSSTNPNLLSDSWLYDAFARRTKATRTDGTATTWSINNCTAVSGGCVGAQNQTVIIATELTSVSGFINDTWSYLDKFDRAIVGKTRLLSGAYNRVDREYDALGRVYRDSAPCVWSSCATYWTTNSYDLANRVTQASRPISDSNPTLQYSYFFHEGLTTRAVDPLGKQSVKIANAIGELARSADHNGYYQNFEYDSFSNPKRVTDQLSNTLQTATYNLRGMLTARTDMDMGGWNFTPNALGETVTQIDAKSQTTTFMFDLLGRLTSRTEAEGTSTWTWGTSSAAKNIGQLASLSGPNYSESYTYNAQANMNARTITAGGTNYLINNGYNSQGKVDSVSYPTSTSGYRLKLKFDYQNGLLYRIRDFNALTTVFWTANASDARNQLTQETLNNGLVTNQSTDAVTGWLKSIQTGVGGGAGVQNLSYQWDLAGNLAQRKDLNQSNLTEDFFYDNLHRLDYSNRNTVQNLDMAYDALGNITSKSDVGTYIYDVTKRHQVTSTSNGWSFGYDNNGNMTSGRSATMTWTSFNYPATIINGTNTSSFSYTPDRQYWQQVSNYTSGGSATTIYIGRLLEKVTTSSGTDFRHMIRAGGSTIIVSRKSSGINTISYVTSDHLGSSSAITDSAGGMLVNSSFDAFGKRRGANWSGSPSAGDWTAIAGITRRGYTEHTMLDNVGLIHMNGRIQDPVTGRFASADPYITEPGFTQNYNRYSYLYNNPLSFIDPSGFGCDRPGENNGSRYDGNEEDDGQSPPDDDTGSQSEGDCDVDTGSYGGPLCADCVPTPHVDPDNPEGLDVIQVCATCNDFSSQVSRTWDSFLSWSCLSCGWPGGSWDASLNAFGPEFGAIAAIGRINLFAKAPAVAKGGEKVVERTYEILDGVRRSKAAHIAGRGTVRAEVIGSGGQTIDVAIGALRSPKGAIDATTGSGMTRWLDTLSRTLSGSQPPPILVQPGARGTPIPDVTVLF